MSELGAGSGSSYPTTLDTDATLEVNSPSASKTKARAEVANDLAAAIIAVQTELGTDPAGTVANVKTFLQTEHDADGTHAAITTSTISASGQITSTLATGTAPLVVTSTTEVANLTPQQVGDGTNIIKTKIINIGDWNMDTTQTVNVSHGLDSSKIRGVDILIRDDAAANFYRVNSLSLGAAYTLAMTTTQVVIERAPGQLFDSVDFDSTSYNRGWITIMYVV